MKGLDFKVYFKLNLIKQAGKGISGRSIYGDCTLTATEKTTVEEIKVNPQLEMMCISCAIDGKALRKKEGILSCEIVKIEEV